MMSPSAPSKTILVTLFAIFSLNQLFFAPINGVITADSQAAAKNGDPSWNYD